MAEMFCKLCLLYNLYPLTFFFFFCICLASEDQFYTPSCFVIACICRRIMFYYPFHSHHESRLDDSFFEWRYIGVCLHMGQRPFCIYSISGLDLNLLYENLSNMLYPY